MAIRGGACTEKPLGTALSGSLISIRTTSVPACWLLVIDWIVFCAQLASGMSRAPAAVKAATAARQCDMVRIS